MRQQGFAVYLDEQVKQNDLFGVGLVPALFHSGYLTIDKEISIPRLTDNNLVQDDAYSFKTPNPEVDFFVKTDIFKDILKLEDKYRSDFSENLPNALLQKNSKEVVRLLHNLFISISYRQHPTAKQSEHAEQLDAPAERLEAEKNYHAILHGALLSAGFLVLSETSGGEGRSDITLFLRDKVCVVIELKYSYRRKAGKKTAGGTNEARKLAKKKAKEKELSAALDIAEEQIRSRDYAGPYRAARWKVICLAVAVRGRTQVEARFVDTEVANGPTGS
ncbi:MAG: PD-(D/E)XK nuclease domain-containing protein [Deltaproteobacteria bacterium]|jgi:hypothetical protein|nr:PD-(D/E)XK nuclease domain-containing protein [Deltaproteobacteria bacterium]